MRDIDRLECSKKWFTTLATRWRVYFAICTKAEIRAYRDETRRYKINNTIEGGGGANPNRVFVRVSFFRAERKTT